MEVKNINSNNRVEAFNLVGNENENSSQKYQELQKLNSEVPSKNENNNHEYMQSSKKRNNTAGSQENYAMTNGNEENINEDANTFRQKLDQILYNGKVNKGITFVSALLSLVVFVIYVVSTYYPEKDFKWFDILNYIIATIFNLETILYLYLAQHRVQYLLQIWTIIELFTSIFPYFASIDNLVMSKIVESARVFYAFRLSKFLHNNFRINENDVVKHVCSMIITFITLIVVCACMFKVVEIEVINRFILNPDYRGYSLTSQTQFHDFLYYIVVTIPTVGYGDIFPISEQGRIVIIILIFVTTYLIPKETGTLFTLLENTSIYSREIYKSNVEIPHLVICGNVTVDAMINFCNELFHSDHGQSEKNVIIMNPSMPGQEMRVFLHAGKYEVNLRYLEGNPMLEKDLDRADIINAKATVIMTDKYTTDPHKIDHKNILLGLAIKKYFLKKKKYDSTIYIQLIKPENKIHYLSGIQSLSLSNKVSSDRMIIVEEIKMNLLSKSCLIPGIIPLIANLVRSSGATEETEYHWLNEYLEGSEQEIYRTTLNEKFKNNTFSQISKEIYKSYNAIAFALEIEIDGKTTISLNPGSFFVEKIVEPRQDVKFFIYVICSDKDVADRIAKADEMDEHDDHVFKFSSETDNLILESKKKKKLSKFQSYMRLKVNDIIQLEENSYYNKDLCDEEEYYFFNKNTLGAPPDVKKDSIRNSAIYRNHIVVCGTHPSLYYYLLPLRAKYFGKENLKYVVILTQDMPKDLWDSISRFENIILINGSPLCIEDLLRANIEYASKAVILENENLKRKSYDDKMVDSERVFIYKAIKKSNPNIQIMTELVYQSNIEYLLPQDELSRMNPNSIAYEQTSVFSSGEVFISSIIDSLTSQAYYNKHIVTIIHQLLTGSKNNSNNTLRNICENVGLKSSNFWQIDIPEQFINKTFGDLYNEFCDYNLIALGLYRLPGARDNYTAYVYTKPEPDTRLTHRDKVFVLSINNIKTYFKDEKKEEQKKQEEKRGNKMSIVTNEEYPKTNSNSNFTPFNYVEEKVKEIEKQVDNLSNMLEGTRTLIHESIASGVKQEIISLLH